MARTNSVHNYADNEAIGAAIALIEKVQTLKDGGARVTIDIGANDTELIESLLRIKMIDNGLVCVAFAREGRSKQTYEEI